MVLDHGMELCCGALVGMGETDAQRVELLFELRELDPTEVPVNFLNPRPGTPSATGGGRGLGGHPLDRPLPPGPARGDPPLRRGPEVTLRDLQAMGMTAGINALIVGNYLTTLGRTAAEDLGMLEDLRMPVGALTAAF